ncbi:S8 family peptidase [Paenibacillus peoriae]|uniref:S8 family peptidase n=1 Tax=Paenibacillus peoriae TaxID=59893 RepID=UPI00215ABE44|nr:S8 family peptidase [Paenibacillus peoriae]
MANYNLTPYKLESTQRSIDGVPEGVKMINAVHMWNEGYKGEGVVIAIIDSGCQVDHPDLKDRIIATRNYVVSEGTAEDVTDFNGHGTHVAGVVAASENGEGIIGVAPQSKLVILKVFKRQKDDRGQTVVEGSGNEKYEATDEDIIQAIKYCIAWRGPNQEKIRIINMSLGGKDSTFVHDAVKEAVNNDILIICAAGNEGGSDEGGDCGILQNELSYPGAYPEVVEVGAIGLDQVLPCFTNTNTEIDLVAPGVAIRSTFKHSDYAVMNGTSMASPHVAGAAALLINYCESRFKRKFTEPEIYAQLIKRTDCRNADPMLVGNGFLVLQGECSNTAASKEQVNKEVLI